MSFCPYDIAPSFNCPDCNYTYSDFVPYHRNSADEWICNDCHVETANCAVCKLEYHATDLYENGFCHECMIDSQAIQLHLMKEEAA